MLWQAKSFSVHTLEDQRKDSGRACRGQNVCWHVILEKKKVVLKICQNVRQGLKKICKPVSRGSAFDKPESHEAIQRFKNSNPAKYIAAINMIRWHKHSLAHGARCVLHSLKCCSISLWRGYCTTCNGARLQSLAGLFFQELMSMYVLPGFES